MFLLSAEYAQTCNHSRLVQQAAVLAAYPGDGAPIGGAAFHDNLLRPSSGVGCIRARPMVCGLIAGFKLLGGQALQGAQRARMDEPRRKARRCVA